MCENSARSKIKVKTDLNIISSLDIPPNDANKSEASAYPALQLIDLPHSPVAH
jgi:hypothetical protein